MAKNTFPNPTPNGDYPLGNARNNKSAEDITGFKYPTGGGDDRDVYKQPQVVANADFHFSVDPNKLHAQDINKSSGTPRVSAGDPASKKINKNGEIKKIERSKNYFKKNEYKYN